MGGAQADDDRARVRHAGVHGARAGARQAGRRRAPISTRVATILFEMLTGRVPFDHADPMMQMRMQVKAPPPRLDMLAKRAPWCTPQLVALVDAALAKDPRIGSRTRRSMMAALDDAFFRWTVGFDAQ